MAKKEGKDSASRFKTNLPSGISSFFSGFMQNLRDNIIVKIQEAAYKIKKKILQDIYTFFLVIVGTAFIAISLVFFLRYYLGLNFAWSFFDIGIILILISLIIKSMKK